MKHLWNIICGMIIGIANVIPGVSGGTMAVSLGIYDRLIGSITGIVKNFKKSILFLLPIILGVAIGVVGFARAMEFLLGEYPLQTGGAFIGLILGGVPMLVKVMRDAQKEQGQKLLTVPNVVAFVLLFALAVGMPLVKSGGSESAVIAINGGNAVIMFFIGIIAAATMVIPGVSGSMMLMILGYYYGILNLVNSFIDALRAFDIGQMLSYCILLVPFGIGVLVGIGGIAKLIEILLKKYCVTTYCAILGLVASSPFCVLYNTGALAKTPSVPAVIVAVVLCIVCCLAIYIFSKKTEGTMKE